MVAGAQAGCVPPSLGLTTALQMWRLRPAAAVLEGGCCGFRHLHSAGDWQHGPAVFWCWQQPACWAPSGAGVRFMVCLQ